jgi:hypothetical protein
LVPEERLRLLNGQGNAHEEKRTMTEKTREKERDALKADIASLRKDIAVLAAGAKKFARTDFQHTLDEAWTQGEKIVKELVAEIERHPRVGSMAAFGLGFIIAKLWYGGSKP